MMCVGHMQAKRIGRPTALSILAGIILLAQPNIASASADVDPYAGSASSRYPELCDLSTNSAVDGCCADSSRSPLFDAVSHANLCQTTDGATVRPNILLIVSDDQAYCYYGFMAGVCESDTSKSCTSQEDCEPAGGRCVSSEDFPTPLGTLRLNELACRNRQPGRRKKSEASVCGSMAGGERKDDAPQKDAGAFPFSREKFPCRTASAVTPAARRPVLRTPNIDKIASEAAVFPRAHVVGAMCKPSRRTLLHGKHQRHLQYLFPPPAPAGADWHPNGKYECRRRAMGDQRRSCLSTIQQCNAPFGESSGVCEQGHTIAFWLKNGHDTRSPVPAGDEYKTLAFAKTEIYPAGQGGFDAMSRTKRGIGKINCDDRSLQADPNAQQACRNALLDMSAPPLAQVFDDKPHGLQSMTEGIHATYYQDPLNPKHYGDRLRAYQTQPFFIWYGPHIPHDGPHADAAFPPLYDPVGNVVHPRSLKHFARVSWLDAGVGALVYHLKRSCTCKGATAQSLYDNTIIVFLSDQGFFMPGAKFNTHDTTHRTPLLISTPDMRLTHTRKLFPNDFASAIDVMPTIMAYAGMTYFDPGAAADDYREENWLARNLKEWIDAGASSASNERKVQYDEQGAEDSEEDAAKDNAGGPRYLVTKPGLFGVCVPNSGGVPHLRACTVAATECASGETCHPPQDPNEQATTAWKRCVNRPGIPCQVDGDCALLDACPGTTCYSSVTTPLPEGMYRDFVGHACSSPTDCVPPGVCRPLVLKIQAKADPNSGGTAMKITDVWDLDYDPDEQDNILAVQSNYLDFPVGDKLTDRARDCLLAFGRLDTQAAVNQPAYKNWRVTDARTECRSPFLDF
jgi:hypothetical protein